MRYDLTIAVKFKITQNMNINKVINKVMRSY